MVAWRELRTVLVNYMHAVSYNLHRIVKHMWRPHVYVLNLFTSFPASCLALSSSSVIILMLFFKSIQGSYNV